MFSPKFQESWDVWKEVVNLLSQLESLSNEDEQGTYLDGFGQELQRLSQIFRRTLEGIDKREVLVAYQCRKDIDITVEKHEEYHKLQEQLLADLQTFLQVFKTFLNHFAILLGKFIPQTEVKGMKVGSFGRLVNSSKSAKTDNPIIDQILKILITKGEIIDKTILEYRDKYLEHPKKLQRKQLTFDASGYTSIYHVNKSPGISFSSDPSYNYSLIVIEKGIFIQRYFLRKVDSEDYYVYLHLHCDLKDGETAEKDKPLGILFDNTVDHFERYGQHGHIFGTPNAMIPSGVPLGLEEKDVIHSPDSIESMLILGNLLKGILPLIISYLESSSSN